MPSLFKPVDRAVYVTPSSQNNLVHKQSLSAPLSEIQMKCWFYGPFLLGCLAWPLLLCSFLLLAALYCCAPETSAGHSLFRFHSVPFLFYSPNAHFVFIPPIVSVLFCFVFLSRASYSQGSNWLCSQKWPPVFISWVLGLQVYSNIPGFYSTTLIV